MKTQKGFTIVELMIVLMILAISALAIFGTFMNNRAATEERAMTNLEIFIADNDIQVKRKTCAGDSDGDGYGSCSIYTRDEKRLRVECPTNWGDVNFWGATSCKEIFYDMNISR